MARRVIMRIDVLPAARQRFTKAPDQFGMTQAAVNSRLLEWMAQQTEEIQVSVLGLRAFFMRS
jgi:hypothetical protein